MVDQTETAYSVVIAGGGFAGGTLALALAKLAPGAFRVALVDAAPPVSDRERDGRGLALSAATKTLLDAVGLWDALEPKAQPIQSIEITDSPLNASLRPHVLGFDTKLNGDAPSAYLVEAGDLLATISEAVRAAPSLDVFAPDSVSGYETDAFGVHVRLASGAVPVASGYVARPSVAAAQRRLWRTSAAFIEALPFEPLSQWPKKAVRRLQAISRRP